MEAAVHDAVGAIIASTGQPLLLSGMFASLHHVATAVRAAGLESTSFACDNALFVAGGLKGADLPADYREFILETFRVPESLVYHVYSMQELNTPFPRCAAGQYHIAPWVIILPLDEPGERVLDVESGRVQGRAAFLDLSLEGRWGGVISGDRVDLRTGTCECGHRGSTVGPDIVRYADLVSGDKISCAGTIDAYVGADQ